MGEDVIEHNNNEGNAKENNKEKLEENSKQKGTNRLKKMAKMASDGERKKLSKENGSNCKDKVGPKDLASKRRARWETKKVSSAGEKLLQVRKRASEGEGNQSSRKAASRGKDISGFSRRMRSSKMAEMGMIFMCNSETKKDCYRYKVLGLPASKRELVKNVCKGMTLFLYDVDLKLMYGIYRAAGPGGYNIEPEAFQSQFPSQVRFRVLDDCKPLAEECFRKAIEKNYYTRTKFDCKLSSEQVKNLCKLFTAASRRSSFKKLGRHINVESNKAVQKDRRSRYHGHHHGYERDGVAYREAKVHRFLRSTRPPAAHSYAHKRNQEFDTYRRHPLAEASDGSFRHEELRDAYEQDLLLDRHNYYRHEPALECHTPYRRDEMMDHNDVEPLVFSPRWDDGFRNRHSYERYPSYHHDPDYRMISPERLSAEYNHVYYSPKYHSTSRPPTQRRDADLLPEHRSSGGLRRYRH